MLLKDFKDYDAVIDNQNLEMIDSHKQLIDLLFEWEWLKTKTEMSTLIGASIASKSIKNKITEVVFDRNGNPYHGRVKAVANAAREAGLKF